MMKCQSSDADFAAVPLVAMEKVLTRVGNEISHLAAVMDQFQSLISPLVVKTGRDDKNFLRQVQNFDHIAQKLNCLADYLVAIAKYSSPDWKIDPNLVTKVVTLADLSERLAVSFNSPRREAYDDSMSGKCEIF